MYLDGPHRRIVIHDATAAVRVILGNLQDLAAGLPTDFGLRLFSPSGQVMWDFSTGAQTVGIANGAITATKIAANVIDAGHLRVDTVVITHGAQIANALITNAHITSLSADKITTGTLQVTTVLGLGPGTMYLDALNRRFVLHDATNAVRAILGRLGSLTTDYGLQLFNAAGQLMWNFVTGATTEGIEDQAINASKIRVGVITAQHMRTDTLVITTAAQIANAIIGDAHITALSATKLRAGTIGATEQIFLGPSIGAASLRLDASSRNIASYDEFGTLRALFGRLGTTGADQYGLRIWNSANQLMWEFNSGASTFGIQDLAVTNAKIVNLDAGKITTGTLQASVGIGVGRPVYLDGVNGGMTVFDAQGHLRVVVGHVGVGPDYGLAVFDAAGNTMWNLTTGATTPGITPNAVTVSITHDMSGGVVVSNTSSELARITVLGMQAGDQVWVVGTAGATAEATGTLCLFDILDAATGLVIGRSQVGAGTQGVLTVQTVYLATAAEGAHDFVLLASVQGDWSFRSRRLTGLHRKR
jgi:hypothetical protein